MAANKKSPISEKSGGAKASEAKRVAGLTAAGDYFSGKGVRGGEAAQGRAGAKRIKDFRAASTGLASASTGEGKPRKSKAKQIDEMRSRGTNRGKSTSKVGYGKGPR